MVEFGRRSSGRAAARRASAAIEGTPKRSSRAEDETMLDVDDAPTPDDDGDDEVEAEDDDDDDDDAAAEDDDDAEDEDGDGDGDDDASGADNGGGSSRSAARENGNASSSAAAAATAAADGERKKADGTERSSAPAPVMMVRRKRLGRPPKNRPPDWDPMVEVPMSEAEIAASAAAAASAGTPRRRGRGGWRGRGGRKGQQAAATQHPVDKDGNLMEIVNDEVALPVDPEGETKVDQNGHLLGGREYRCRTFTVPGRGDRLYMLSTEPARCVGFRDSYLFFAKHRRLYKIIVEEDEKRDMIEREIIPHSYKGRAIGIVTARSVFREFGALIVVGGRRIVDDYDVARARAEGAEEGALADPNDHYVPGEPYNKNQYVAWHGASSVYHLNQPATQQQQAAKPDVKKRRVAVNNDNWQYEHALEASNFNSTLTAARQATLHGVYDIHTNQMQYPATMQPRTARAVQVAPGDAASGSPASAIFPPLPPQVARNFLVTDLCLETPPVGVAPVAYERLHETPDTAVADFLSPFQGLGAVSEEIQDLLPPECRAAFDKARANEARWLGRWGDEKDAMCRREPVIDKAIVPYAMTL